MTGRGTPENFIPCSLHKMLRLCAADAALGDQGAEFESFARRLIAYQRHCARILAQPIRDNFAVLDPDAELEADGADRDAGVAAAEVADGFARLCAAANFRPYTEAELADAMDTATLIPLNTQVDFNDFARIAVFYRGDDFVDLTIRRGFRKQMVRVDNLRRVAMLLEVREAHYFEALGRNMAELGAAPGKVYLFLYKNIPRNDLELLFPNVKISMRLTDRLLFGVPAVAGLVPLVLKVLPSLALVGGAIVMTLFGAEAARLLNLSDSGDVSQYSTLVALSIMAILVGGFAVRQYNNYSRKKLKFLKRVKDTLFFKSLATNSAALSAVADMAEQETVKELLLIFYVLATAREPLSSLELDQRAEAWLLRHCGKTVDFDVDKSLRNARRLEAGAQDAGRLVKEDEHGRRFVESVASLHAGLDILWERSFDSI